MSHEKRRWVIKVCETCGNEYPCRPDRITTSRFCSLKCKRLTPDQKTNLSLSKKGKPSSFKGKHFSEESKKKISLSKLGKQCGSKNPNWRGGTSFQPYCEKFNKDFKERVRAFFGYKCPICGKSQDEDVQSLHVHHIKHNKDACCNPNSPRLFIALCSNCHGIVNNHRSIWESKLISLIEQEYNGKCYFTKEEFKRQLKYCAQ